MNDEGDNDESNGHMMHLDNDGEDIISEDIDEVDDEDLIEADSMQTGGITLNPLRDDAILVYSEHKGSEDDEDNAVFCVDIHNTTLGTLVVTGGQDDTARVWNITTGATLLTCTGHQESVTNCAWSHDGTYLATSDLTGLVKVWNIQTQSEVLSHQESEEEIEWLTWHPRAPLLLLGSGDGSVWLILVADGQKRFFPPHNKTSATVGLFLPDGKQACVGYEDGVVKIWNLKTAEADHIISGHGGHTDSVCSIDCMNDIAFTGSTDGTTKIINIKTGKVVSSLSCGQGRSEGQDGDTVMVRLCPFDSLAASGTGTGVLAIWDLNTGVCRHSVAHPDGIVSLCWSQKQRQHVYTACQDGAVRLWDALSAQLVRVWLGHSALIHSFHLDRDEKFVVTASDDGTARVFSLDSPVRETASSLAASS